MKLKLIILSILIVISSVGGLAWAQDDDPPTSAQFIAVTQTELRLRSLPTLGAPTLQVAPQYTTVRVLGRNADATWYQVEYKGVVGWMSEVYLGLQQDPALIPVTDATDPDVDPRPEERTTGLDGTVVETGTMVVFATQARVNVRTLPQEDADILGQLERNERALVSLVDPTLLWGQIDFEGGKGWVALYVVNVIGDIRTVEIIGQPDTTSDLPLGPGFATLEQRQAIQDAQDYLGRYLAAANYMEDIMANAVSAGFINCNTTPVPFFRAYRPDRSDYVLEAGLEAVVNDMNASFEILNDVRFPWVAGCSIGGTLNYRNDWPGWLQSTQNQIVVLDDIQRRLALLSAQ